MHFELFVALRYLKAKRRQAVISLITLISVIGVVAGVAGLVQKARPREVHRKRRPRRPLPGILLHLDGSSPRWFQDDRWYDLIEVLDDDASTVRVDSASPNCAIGPNPRGMGGLCCACPN